MKTITTFISILLLAACTTVSLPPSEQHLAGPRPSQRVAERAVHLYIEKAGLKDPDSARVRNIRIDKPVKWFKGLAGGGGYTYGWRVSFELNAKNSYGAYVGYEAKHVLISPDGRVHWRY